MHPSKYNHSLTAVLLMGILLVGGCNDSPTAPGGGGGGPIVPPQDCDETFVQQVFDLVNQERASADVPPLEIDLRLAVAAQDHADWMAANGVMSHTGEDGSSPAARATAAGFPYRTLGENVAAGYSSPEAVVQGWMNSSGHRANILRASFTLAAVGYTYSSGSGWGHYWVNMFGSASDGGAIPENGCHP
jgi:uncharacterized protein YkwD